MSSSTKDLYPLLQQCLVRDENSPIQEVIAQIQAHPELVKSDPDMLIRAVQWNLNTEIIQALVEACPDALSCQDEKGLSPLSWLGDLILRTTDTLLLNQVEKLYPHDGSTRRGNPLLSQDIQGNSPLHRCCDSRNTYPEVVIRAIQVCPESIQVENHDGKTARDMALGNWRLVDEDNSDDDSPPLLAQVAQAFNEAETRLNA